MTAAERGVHLTMLLRAWLRPGLPREPQALASVLAIPSGFDAGFTDLVRSQWTTGLDGRLYHRYQEDLREKAFSEFKRQSSGGRKARPHTRSQAPEGAPRQQQATGRDSTRTKEWPKKRVSNRTANRILDQLESSGSLPWEPTKPKPGAKVRQAKQLLMSQLGREQRACVASLEN